jgi:hypothetical protein
VFVNATRPTTTSNLSHETRDRWAAPLQIEFIDSGRDDIFHLIAEQTDATSTTDWLRN